MTFHTRQLNEKITLKTKVLSQDSDFGDQVHTLSTLATVWAKVEPLGGSEEIDNDLSTNISKYRFTIHHRTDLTNIHVITWNDDNYDITNVQPLPREKATVITAEFNGDESGTTATPITSFTYSNNGQSTPGTITAMAATVAGDVLNFTVDANDTLPVGLTLNQTTGAITGSIAANADFDVVAMGRDLQSSASVNVTHTYTAISAPTGLTATSASVTSIDLSWTNVSTGYVIQVERSLTTGSGFSLITTTAIDATTYTDTGLTEGTEYFYRVRAVQLPDTGPYSNEDSAIPDAGYETEYQAIMDRATALGYSLPSASVQGYGNTLVAALKTASLWEHLDVFYVFATDGDSDFATLNWKSPSNNQATKVSSPTFTTDQGFKGDGVAANLDLNFDPSTDATNFERNDNSHGGYIRQLPTGNGLPSYHDGTPRIQLSNYVVSGGVLLATSSSQDFVSHTSGGTAGLYEGYRSASGTHTVKVNQTDTNSVSHGSQAISSGALKVFTNGSIYSDAQISMIYVGGKEIGQGNMLTPFEAYMDSLGTGVVS